MTTPEPEAKRIQLTGKPYGVYQLLLDGQDISTSVASMTIHIPSGSRAAEISLELTSGAIEADLYTTNLQVEPNRFIEENV